MTFGTDDGKEAIVFVYNIAGTSSERRLTFGGRNRIPIWSGDSKWIAFQSDREGNLGIFRQRADGSAEAERLTTADKETAHVPESLPTERRNPVIQRNEERCCDAALIDAPRQDDRAPRGNPLGEQQHHVELLARRPLDCVHLRTKRASPATITSLSNRFRPRARNIRFQKRVKMATFRFGRPTARNCFTSLASAS